MLYPNNSSFIIKSVRFILFFMILIWCAGFSFQSLFPSSDLPIAAYPFLKKIYGTVCHQLPEKTFKLMGFNLLVCARCTGIYTGALLTALLSLFFFSKIKLGINLFYFALLPIILDVGVSTFYIFTYSKVRAFFTGLFFGSVVFLYILEAIENYFNGFQLRKNE